MGQKTHSIKLPLPRWRIFGAVSNWETGIMLSTVHHPVIKFQMGIFSIYPASSFCSFLIYLVQFTTETQTLKWIFMLFFFITILPPALPDQNIANKSNWLMAVRFCLFVFCVFVFSLVSKEKKRGRFVGNILEKDCWYILESLEFVTFCCTLLVAMLTAAC